MGSCHLLPSEHCCQPDPNPWHCFQENLKPRQRKTQVRYDKVRLSSSVADIPQHLSIKQIITSIDTTFLLFSDVYTDDKGMQHKKKDLELFVIV